MQTLVNKWRNKAVAIRRAVEMLKDLDDSIVDEESAEPDAVMLKREELEMKERALEKTAAIYDECANELTEKLWEV